MIKIFDDVLPDPDAYRAAALALPYVSVNVGHATFHGIALAPDPALGAWLAAQVPDLAPGLTFFRKSPFAQDEPNLIHTDVDMGDVTVILYLNPTPPAEDGTAFWRHRATGLTRAEGVLAGDAGKDLSAWDQRRVVSARFNRAVLFAAPLFHSRAIAANYGVGDDARLIQVLFARIRE